jgi:hypothetical protein
MPLTMAVVVLKVVALVLQGIEGLVCALSPGAPAPHEVPAIPLVDSQLCDPAEVWALVVTDLPVLDDIEAEGWV